MKNRFLRKAPTIGKNSNTGYIVEWLAIALLLVTFAYNVSALYLPAPEDVRPLDVVFRTVAAAIYGYFTGIASYGNPDKGDFGAVLATVVILTLSFASAVILFAARFTIEITAVNVAAVSQFRDMMSMGIGSAISAKGRVQA